MRIMGAVHQHIASPNYLLHLDCSVTELLFEPGLNVA